MTWLPRLGRREEREEGADAVERAARYGVLDLLTEATHDLGARPARLLVTLAGAIFGVGALVATVGLSQSAAAQIARDFDAAASSQAIVRPVEIATADGSVAAAGQLPWDAAARVGTLSGVASAALLSEVPSEGLEIAAVQVNDPAAAPSTPPALMAASGDLVGAVQATVRSGRVFDDGHDARGDRVAVLGAHAAERFGIPHVGSGPSIFLGGRPYAVIGIIADAGHRAELLNAVIIPTGTARADFGLAAPDEVQVRLEHGGGPIITAQAAQAIVPDEPDTLEVASPSGAGALQQNVQGSLDLVFLALAVIVLLAAGFGIANVTMLSVLERTGEIGLRRALGATRRQIAAQFVVESGVIGAIGGLIGAAAGVTVVVAVAVVQGWPAVLNPAVALGGGFLGTLVGLVAGGVPARRAARIEPAVALRSE